MTETQKKITEAMAQETDIFRFLEKTEGFYDERSVGQRIKDYFTEHGYSSAEVFAKGGLDRSYGYDILSDRTKHPGRDKIIMIAIGMGICLADVRDFMELTGFSPLEVTRKRDSIISFGISHGFEIRAINEVLYTEGLQELK